MWIKKNLNEEEKNEIKELSYERTEKNDQRTEKIIVFANKG